MQPLAYVELTAPEKTYCWTYDTNNASTVYSQKPRDIWLLGDIPEFS